MKIKKSELENILAKSLEKKLPEMLKFVDKGRKDTAKKKGITKDVKADSKKSVMRSEERGEIAIKAPFVKLGSEMKTFVERFKERMAGVVRAADQNEGTDTLGGYLVAPAEFYESILKYQWQESIVRRFATIRTCRGNTYKINKLNQSTNSYGGVVMSWITEGTQLSRTHASFEQIELTLGKLTGLDVVSNELLQDSLENIANYLVQVFGAAVTFYEDTAFLNGDGANNSPTGVLQTTGIQTVNRATANQIKYADVNSMYHKLRTTERKNGVWVGSATAIEYVDGLVDTTGRPLLSQSVANGMEMRMKTRPVIELDEAYLPALGTKGDLMFVDFSKYFIVDKLGLRIDASAHSRFEYDEVELRFVKRVAGQLALPSAAVALDIP